MRKDVVSMLVGGFTICLALAGPGKARADGANGDSNADAPDGFANAVRSSQALVIRVPIDGQGREYVDAAQAHLVSDTQSSVSTDLRSAFDQGLDATAEKYVTSADVAHDSDTCGWFGRPWRGYGWQPTYFAVYRPTYVYQNNFLYYGNPVSQDFWGNYGNYGGVPSAGYRYYRYPATW